MEFLRSFPSPLSQTVLETTPQSPAIALAAAPLNAPTVGQRASSAIVFIDAGVGHYQDLVAGVQPGAEVYVLDPMQDAVSQITQTLLGKTGVSSLQIVSHGEAGSLQLGSSALNLTTIRSYADQFQAWGQALTADADILLYGCDVAADPAGKAFVTFMSQMTGADVAASTDLTGKGGNWALEYTTGSIEATTAFSSSTLATYEGTLNAALTFTGAAVSFTENAAATTVFGNAGVANPPGTSSFQNLTLTVTIASGGEASDRLTIRNANNVTVSGNTVSHQNNVVGTFSGGGGSTPLAITFNTTANRQSAQAVLQQIQFSNTSDNPSSTSREINAVVSTSANALGSAITQTVNVIPVNDAPTITGFTKTGTEDTPLTFAAADFTGSYSDLESTPLSSIRVSVLPTKGSLKLNGVAVTNNQAIASSDLANLSYIPNLNVNAAANGTDQFTWFASDGSATSATSAQVTISLGAVNDAPVVSPTIKEGSEDVPLSFSSADFIAGFTDVDGNTLQSIQIKSAPIHGILHIEGVTVSLDTDIAVGDISKLVYTGDADYNGVDAFDWTASDGTASSEIGTLFLSLAPTNDEPSIIAAVTKSGNEDTAISFSTTDFSSQFTDIDQGDTLTAITITTLPGQGTLRLNNLPVTLNQVIFAEALSGLSYSPTANYNGSDSFSWTASDGLVSSQAGQVNLAIAPVNDAATITSFTKAGTEDTALTFVTNGNEGSDFTANFTDIDGDSLSSIKITSLPAGQLTLSNVAVTLGQVLTQAEIANLSYTPILNANGLDSFGWEAFDGSTTPSNAARVTLNLAPVNDAPTISLLTKSGNEDTPIALTENDFASRFTDVDGNPLASITILDAPTRGTLQLGIVEPVTVTANQVITAADLATLRYVPNQNYFGSDDFGWTASDGLLPATSSARVSLAIAPVNDAPVVNLIEFFPDEDVLFNFFTKEDFEAAYTDVENNPLTSITITDLPDHGTLSWAMLPSRSIRWFLQPKSLI